MEARRRVSVITPVYRSGRWLPGYFAALEALELDNESLEVVLVDNDPKAMPLEEYIALAGGLELKVLSMDRNVGFAAACNRGARQAEGDLLLFLNVDTEIAPNALRLLRHRLEHDPGCAMAEARQAPVEHPKFWWPVTGRVDWCSACCLLMRRDLFLECGGFDEIFFMYGEDVDLSFRLRDKGYRLAYVPEAVCVHHDGEKDRERKLDRTYNLIKSSLLLRARYSTSWHTLCGFWLELSRTVLRRRGKGRSMALAAARDALFLCPRMLVQRWASTLPATVRLFQDEGGCTLHWRFPPPVPSTGVGAPADGGIRISVVIATENRDFMVEPLAESILRQFDPLGRCELIVVDHGPVVGAADGLAERFGDDERFILVDLPEGTASDALNAGMRRASGDVVLFLDDTAVPSGGFVASHLALHGQFDVVQGPVHRPWPVAGSPFRKYLRDGGDDWFRSIRYGNTAGGTAGRHDGAGETSAGETLDVAWQRKPGWLDLNFENLSVKRDLVDRLCGEGDLFDRKLWSDQAARRGVARRMAGLDLDFVEDARLVVLGRERPRFRAFLAENFKLGYGAARLAKQGADWAGALSSEDGDARTFIRRLLSFVFIVSPLAVPAFFFDVLLPPRLKLNPLAAWWFDSAAELCRRAGRLWFETFGGRGLDSE